VALAEAIGGLLADAEGHSILRERGLAWATDHTAEEQAKRLIGWMRDHFTDLAWPE
jgi:hypothetical protein